MKTETYVCQECGIDVVRPAARGQRPKWCPECRRSRCAKVKVITCEQCGAEAMTWRKGRFCSSQCSGAARVKPKPPRKPKLRLEPKPKFCVIFTPNCAICGRVFVTRYTVSTCSEVCKQTKLRIDKREHKHRRRARQRGAFVAPVFRLKIYERDAWRCQICGRMVDRDAAVPHPLAPTLDHLVPLARGGTHEPANVRLAHFLCNSRRGAADDSPQLALFG